jgi:threonine/homoserine/homoserine lactone efflux protein
MDVLNFVATIILITMSGALAPGPLFFATISHGSKSGAKSGLMFSVAHSLVEFTLVMLFALGLLTVANRPIIRLVTGIIGGLVLLGFGIVQILNSLKLKNEGSITKEVKKQNLLLIGLAFTGLNPFFIVWWLTVGANLILLSLEFAALPGVVFMYICHVWIDYVWLTLVAHFSKMGTDIIGLKWYRVIMIIFGFILIYYGLIFLKDSFV